LKLEHVLKNSDVGVKRGWALRAVSTVIAAALLASCGGEAIEDFRPDRVTAFGDELSVIDDSGVGGGSTNNGVKYTVNSSVAPYNCLNNPIWIQVVAGSFGTAFQQCAGTLDPTRLGRTWAQPNATVAMVTAQIDAFLAPPNTVTNKDLVLVMVGMHDVLDLYLQYNPATPDASRDALAGQANLKGLELGAQVVRLTNLGVKVVVPALPDQGFTPFALAEGTQFNTPTTPDNQKRQFILSTLTTAFNNGLQTKMQEVRGGGRSAGLVLTNSIFNNPTANGFADSTTMVCEDRDDWSAGVVPDPTPLRTCNETASSVEPDAYGGYLWVDALRYTPAGHGQLGGAAAGRANDNPF
jgi:phospholipase/lecithinase/hemolysin